MSLRISAATQGEREATRFEPDGSSGAGNLASTRPGEGDELAVVRVMRSTVVSRTLAAYRRRRGGSDSGIGSSGGSSGKKGLLSDKELRAVEENHPDGITAVQVVEIFAGRGVRFSEASFRKYVQQGLLPRSRRVGRKGKHRGSMGVYPAKTVRRINEIKRLMGDGYTIEEIQNQFLRFTDVIESLEEGFSEIFSRLDEEVMGPRFDKQTRRSLAREVREARKSADELLARLGELSHRVARPRGDEARNAGAAGSAEDLL